MATIVQNKCLLFCIEFVCKIGVDTAEKEPSEVSKKLLGWILHDKVKGNHGAHKVSPVSDTESGSGS